MSQRTRERVSGEGGGKATTDPESSPRSPHADGYEVRPSRLRTIALAGAAITLAVGCAFVVSSGMVDGVYQLLVVLFGIPFFGACALLWAYQSLDTAPVLRIDEDGISYRAQTRNLFLPWDRIVELRYEEMDHRGGTTAFLRIEVSEFDQSQQRWWHELLFEINRAFMDDDGDVHRIALGTYGIDFDAAAAAARERSDVPIRRE